MSAVGPSAGVLHPPMQQQAYAMSYPPSFMQGLNSSKVYSMNRSNPSSGAKPLLTVPHAPSATKAPSPHMYFMPDAPSDEGVTCSPVETQALLAPFDAPADRPEVVAARQEDLRAAFANRLVLRVHNIPSGTSEPEFLQFLSFLGIHPRRLSLDKPVMRANGEMSAILLFKAHGEFEAALARLAGVQMRDRTLQVLHPQCEGLLFVGNLEPSFTSEALRGLCEQHGLVVRAFVVLDVASGTSKGYGCVEYATRSQASDAKTKLSAKVVGGRSIRVDWIDILNELVTLEALQSRTLFVDRLPKHFRNMAGLQSLCSRFGAVTFCRLAVSDGVSRGFAFVDFATADDASRAYRGLVASQVDDVPIRASFGNPGKTGEQILNKPEPASRKGSTSRESSRSASTSTRHPSPPSLLDPSAPVFQPGATARPRTMDEQKRKRDDQLFAPTPLTFPHPHAPAHSTGHHHMVPPAGPAHMPYFTPQNAPVQMQSAQMPPPTYMPYHSGYGFGGSDMIAPSYPTSSYAQSDYPASEAGEFSSHYESDPLFSSNASVRSTIPDPDPSYAMGFEYAESVAAVMDQADGTEENDVFAAPFEASSTKRRVLSLVKPEPAETPTGRPSVRGPAQSPMALASPSPVLLRYQRPATLTPGHQGLDSEPLPTQFTSPQSFFSDSVVFKRYGPIEPVPFADATASKTTYVPQVLQGLQSGGLLAAVHKRKKHV